MLAALMLAAALTTTRLAPLASAIEHYRTLETYQVTLRSSHATGEDHIRYYYRKPGFVRMEFIRPHAGAVLVYSPLTQRVRVWPLGAGVHRYELWLDTATRFPLKVVSRDLEDAVIETVTMDALEINVPVAEALFDPGRE